MKFYSNLKRESEFYAARDLKNIFPELNKLNSDEIENRLRKSDIEIFTETKRPVKWWIRLTLPFAVIVWIILFVGLPITFIVRGEWGYKIDRIMNWFKQLGLS